MSIETHDKKYVYQPYNNKALVHRIVIIPYLFGILFWFFTWFLVDGYSLLSFLPLSLRYFPFLLCPIVLAANVVLSLKTIAHGDIEVEMEYVGFVERNASYVLTAILVTFFFLRVVQLPFGAFIPLSEHLTTFLGGALIASVVGVFPLYWIPPNEPVWLLILRHWKTIPLTYSISFFLAGLIEALRFLSLLSQVDIK